MAFCYETHLHTCQGSACGRSSGKEHVRFYKDIGYTGIFVTDHFFHGNTAVPRDLPWREWVNRYCAGYEEALNEGIKLGLDVFFGWEETFDGDDYLIYGLDKAWLLEHPEVRSWTRRQQHDAVRAAGGCVVQAHPYRVRDYIHTIWLNPYVDGVEVANAGNAPFSDAYAYAYARERGLFMTAGSDNHCSVPGQTTRELLYGIQVEERLTGAADYAGRILKKAPVALLCPNGRFEMDDLPPLPLSVRHAE